TAGPDSSHHGWRRLNMGRQLLGGIRLPALVHGCRRRTSLRGPGRHISGQHDQHYRPRSVSVELVLGLGGDGRLDRRPNLGLYRCPNAPAMNPLNARWTMYRTQSSFSAVAIVAALALGACQERAPTEASSRMLAASAASLESSGRYVVVFSAERVPVDFGERIAELGGSIESAIDSIGVAGVTGLSEVAATELGAAADIRAVEPDPMTRPRDDGEAVDGLADEAVNEAAVPADATASPTTAQFYARQWNLRAVFAPDAWAAGFLGSRDVVVAILDTGIDYTNPDLAGLVDLD